MGQISEKKSDAAFPFGTTIKGIIGNKKRRDSLRTSIELILTTPKGTVVWNPEFGSWIPYLVFDLITDSVINLIYFYVQKDLEQDSRIKVTNISIKREQKKIVIVINYEDQDDHDRIQQQTTLQFAKE
jgi:phage baseplate assembly protein W